MGSGVQGSGFGVQGSGFRVQGPGCRVQGAGFNLGVGVAGVDVNRTLKQLLRILSEKSFNLKSSGNEVYCRQLDFY